MSAAGERSAQLEPLLEKAVTQIRDALATLSYAADGWYEDEAQVALDALDWLEAKLRADAITPCTPS